ncbi:UdgX family uracil-DNA binding protein [Microbacterium sp. SD291]|uniref:UdgX family uracil-DNA binding protein n=1 Tax=Microbacterium sp. SD291 TaxID=2782007 RepID=UPI001A9750E3|nr:UdgX family uracil-DNA binding protein [Microbacterium sp. SD291]MBO0982073.1 UdgX family uracil-DNA binding protein [Microbacterium sp. SD291]
MSTENPVERPGAQEWVPEHGGVDDLRHAAEACRGCELWKDATQVVFSTGSAGVDLMLVGEQPGDREDRTGEPFVGPAGRMLDDALDAAEIDRGAVYLTNAVKHFRFELRGKRRIHEKPATGQLVACRPWLEAEIAAVRPQVIVAMGATAARSVLGRPVKIGEVRGAEITAEEWPDIRSLVTVHPSSLLRLREDADREAAFRAFVADLRAAAELVDRR